MTYDDFDTQIQPEEICNPDEQFETCNRPDAPDDDFYDDIQWEYMNGEFPDDEEGFPNDEGGLPYDEGSDRDNWEDEQVFQDSHFDY